MICAFLPVNMMTLIQSAKKSTCYTKNQMDDQNKPFGSSKPQATTPSDTSPAANPNSVPVTPIPGVIYSVPNNPPPAKSRKSLLVTVGILFLAVFALGVAAGVYYHVSHKNSTVSPVTPASSAAAAKNVNPNVISANNNFGMNVFNLLVKQTPLNNIFISPSSIALALSMVYNGAQGSTQTAMSQVLNYQGLSLATINNSSSALITSLKNPDPKVTLAIANSVWIKQGVGIKKAFLNTTQQDYQAKATTLNFSSSSAPSTINNWVSNATGGKITSIVGTIPQDEIMYLINAVYFKGAWHTVFDPSLTQKSPFTTGSGASVQTPLMSQTSNYNYYGDASVQAIELPYGNNQRISMNVYLPADMNSFLQNLSYSQLASIDSKFSNQSGTILLPKFTLNYGQSLSDTLKALGMGVAFNPYGEANFNGITNNAYISDVEHKTYISVDEQGTTAAAATSVGVGDAAVISGFNMDVNKPFLLTIQDSLTKAVLFVGVIQNPNQ